MYIIQSKILSDMTNNVYIRYFKNLHYEWRHFFQKVLLCLTPYGRRHKAMLPAMRLSVRPSVRLSRFSESVPFSRLQFVQTHSKGGSTVGYARVQNAISIYRFRARYIVKMDTRVAVRMRA